MGFLLGIFLGIHGIETAWKHESWAILMGKPFIQPDVRMARTANPATVLRTAKLVVAGRFSKSGKSMGVQPDDHDMGVSSNV